MSGVYDSEHYALGYPPGIEHHFWHVARNALVARELDRCAQPGERVLDVGCGPGIFVRAMLDSRWRVEGVEAGRPPLASELRQRISTGTDVFDLPQAQRHAVRVLLLLDVIEHMDDRVAFLARLRQAFPHCRARK